MGHLCLLKQMQRENSAGRLIVMLLVALFFCGCAGQKRTSRMVRPLAEPLLPFSHGRDWQYQDFTEGSCVEPVPGDVIHEMLLTYISRGRDFTPPGGADGYVLRVILLDDEFNSLPIKGSLFVGLFSAQQGRNDSGLRSALLRWRIAPGTLERYWYEGNVLSSYLLRLDWADETPLKGNYILAVRFEYMQGQEKRILCHEIPFGDNEALLPEKKK